MNKRVRIATTALALALGLAGCATASPTRDDAPKAGSNADKKSADKKAAAQAKANDKANLASLHFGDTAKWPSGLTVTLSKPTKFTPSDTAAGAKGKNHVQLTMTVVNGTDKPIEPSLLSPTMQSGDEEASRIFDVQLGDEPSTKLLPGRQAKWRIAFSVKNPRDLVLEVRPFDFTSDSALFSS